MKAIDPIEKRWRQAWNQPRSRGSWLYGARLRGVPVVLSLVASLLLIGIDHALLLGPASPGQPGPELLTEWISLGLLALGLGNGLLIHLYLSTETRGERAFRLWVLPLRFLLASVPGIGLCAIPLWRWLACRRPGWAARPDASLDLVQEPRPGGRLDRMARETAADRSLFLWIIANTIVLLVALPVLAVRIPITALAAVLHFGACASGLPYVLGETRQARASRGRTAAALAALSLTLVPIPFVPLGGVLATVFLTPRAGEDTSIHAVLDKANRRISPGDRPPREPGIVELGNELLGHRKMLLLPLEAAALGWALAHNTRLQPVLAAAKGTTLAVGACGLLLMLLQIVQALFQNRIRWLIPATPPYGRAVAATQLGAYAGLAIGEALARGDTAGAGAVIGVFGLLGLAVTFFGFFSALLPIRRDTEHQERSQILWLLLFLFVTAAGREMARPGSLQKPAKDLLWLGIVLALLFGPGLGHQLLPALLRPFTSSDARRGDLPRMVRGTISFLRLTAILPLGGLAVPLWLYLRQRWWPRWIGHPAQLHNDQRPTS